VFSSVRVPQRPRHPEVDEKRTTRLEPNNQILAAAIDLRHALALELPRDLDRIVRTRESWIGDLDVLEATAFQRRREPTADALDLG
jgi:hypothetical protein